MITQIEDSASKGVCDGTGQGVRQEPYIMVQEGYIREKIPKRKTNFRLAEK